MTATQIKIALAGVSLAVLGAYAQLGSGVLVGGIGGAGVAGAAPIQSGLVAQAAPALPASGLAVTGEGTARAEPDLGYVTTGVVTRGQTAREAQEENNRLMQAVVAAMRAGGIAEGDVRTSGITLFPVHDPASSRIAAYEATNQVRVTVHDVRRVGEVLDAAVGAGANQAGEVRFAFRDEAPLRRQALDQAVKEARSTADAIAASAGLRIVSVQALLDESPSGPGYPAPLPAQLEGPGAPPVQPGQLAVTARVRVVYQIE